MYILGLVKQYITSRFPTLLETSKELFIGLRNLFKTQAAMSQTLIPIQTRSRLSRAQLKLCFKISQISGHLEDLFQTYRDITRKKKFAVLNWFSIIIFEISNCLTGSAVKCYLAAWTVRVILLRDPALFNNGLQTQRSVDEVEISEDRWFYFVKIRNRIFKKLL